MTPYRQSFYRPLLALLLFCLAAGLTAAQAAEAKRVALLVGNARYTDGMPPLQNPPRDVRQLADSLKKLGFEVMQRSR